MPLQLAAVVILYHPGDAILENIYSYLESVQRLYIVDNSEDKNQLLLQKLKVYSHVRYIDNNGNKGIANALNRASQEAIKEKFSWILTMDQDSYITSSMLSKMCDAIAAQHDDDLCMVSPFHANNYQPSLKQTENYSEIFIAMTSGCLLRLESYKDIGPFDEAMFIDHVDHEYCLRSHQKGYRIIRVNGAVLKHNLGNLKEHKILGKRFFSVNHSPVRSYYSFRNRVRLIGKYFFIFPGYSFHSMFRFLIDIGIIVLYEDQKMDKLKMMAHGFMDGLKGRYGKFNG